VVSAEAEAGYKSAAANAFGHVELVSLRSQMAEVQLYRAPILYEVNALSFMLNGMLDFGDDDGIQGFVGGGVGAARTEVTNIFAGPYLDDSVTALHGSCLQAFVFH
jgi:opacity protein-like surface antigen